MNWYPTVQVPTANLSHDKSYHLIFGNDGAMGFKYFLTCQCEVHRTPEAMYTFGMKTQYSTTFRCTGASLASAMTIITADCALHICQSHVAIIQSRKYLVLMSECETRLPYLWQSCCICWWMIPVQVNQKFLATYRYLRLITAYLLIPFGTRTDLAILSTCVTILMAQPQILLNVPVHAEFWAYHCDRSITAYLPMPFGN